MSGNGANEIANSLRRNALAGGGVALAALAVSAAACATPLSSLAVLAAGLAALASAAYLLFDAALFRLAGSYPDEAEGLAAIDDALDRMGLRVRGAQTRPLAPRIAGSRRILAFHRVALAVLVGALAFQAFAEAARC